MKHITIILSFIIIFSAQDAFMSGMEQLEPLDKCFSKNSYVFLVTLTDTTSGIVEELDNVSKDISGQFCYIAKINEIIHNKVGNSPNPEQWHIHFSAPYDKMLKKIKDVGPGAIKVNDKVIITDHENIQYSIMYHVDGMHKIFYYYACQDAAKSIKINKKYFLIVDNTFSPDNGVLYGNVDFGLYPATNTMRKKILQILKQSNSN
jgi:hypothetical protein